MRLRPLLLTRIYVARRNSTGTTHSDDQSGVLSRMAVILET